MGHKVIARHKADGSMVIDVDETMQAECSNIIRDVTSLMSATHQVEDVEMTDASFNKDEQEVQQHKA